MHKKTIISEFFTTVSLNQALQSMYLMTFWLWKLKYWKDSELLALEFLNKLKFENKNQEIITFYNWRSIVYTILKWLNLKNYDEVIVNAYNCVSVSNAVIQSWAKIIYSDIEKETLSFDFDVLKSNITKNTKVIIIQHTFWKQAKYYDKIIELSKEKWILIIEDCAHSLWNKSVYKWDFLLFSTGRDKVISSVTWWIFVINNNNYFNKFDEIKKSLKMPSIKLILQNLMYNIVWYKAYKYYDFLKLWKIIIFISRKLNIITEILTPSEKACNFDNFYLDYPNALAYLSRKELKKLDKYTKIRLENIKYYLKNLNKKYSWSTENFTPLKWNYNWFRFPILLKSEEEKNKLYNLARKNNILLWNYWTWQAIIPIWTKLENIKYKIWSCPIAEDISKRILTLPNHKLINKKDLEKITKLLNEF
jgi:dTDP-4-amino-4,6-dideoxygalactose transaminase